jgi:hypothetical protein
MVSPPVIFIDGHDFSFYESVEAVGRHLETWYPEGPYVAYEVSVADLSSRWKREPSRVAGFVTARSSA